MRVGVIGGGGWGLALAKLLCENGHRLSVWEHNPLFLRALKENHANPDLLPGIELPSAISYTGSFDELAAFAPQLLIFATPTQYLRETLFSITGQAAELLFNPGCLEAVVNVAKGIEKDSLRTPSEVLRAFLPPELGSRVCTLSGPSHAEEVARGIPTTVVIAGPDESLLKLLQNTFSNQYFRVYRSTDLIGVELGGAVKNVISIAAGIIAGLGFGDNTIGALLTRGLVEIQRLGFALGARPETFLGLSGVGDLITTATSPHSRNRYVGFEIGAGRKLPEILSAMNMVAEGVETTSSVHDLAARLQVDMPITEEVYQVLFHGRDPRQAITGLMTRDLKAE